MKYFFCQITLYTSKNPWFNNFFYLSLGGSVMIQRVNGSLAVSRALGDFEYKNVDGKGPTEQLVSPEPEFYMKKR